ncbi:MAG: DUF853 family protein [Deltaproteobacteria bacterium]|nr:DUF853 family protein [Deltaproteobacteria bacterium]
MQDYEKLGLFYLGREVAEKKSAAPELVLYDAKDLTTHGVIVGMTGSGKTGLGLALLEEALIDGVPVIAIDPKGDLTNLLLTFPDLAPADFEPWVNPSRALQEGLTPAELAAREAQTWKKGLAGWGQEPARIARLKAAAEFAVYTPGSSAGLPVSLLKNFDPPSAAVAAEPDLLRERVEYTATGLLTLAGIDADPLTSREHILVSNLLNWHWTQGRGLGLAELIRGVQGPPFERVGVLDLESFFPAKERFALALGLNNLLASPGFAAWLEGPPLDAASLLYTPSGRPRAAVFTISHLSDAQRMFFVTLLLGQVISWMRTQPGTASLRALLYLDEVFGYLPPQGNPPSKRPLLTLLKQARAFGLGVVLATQNPVDLDYKALSNAGTWWVGRLQTERDRERLLDGLAGADAGAGLSRPALEKLIAGLGKRRFFLHNVHENRPVVLESRWCLSYLAGPLTREQIKRLPRPELAAPAAASTSASSVPPPPPPPPSGAPTTAGPPLAPPGVKMRYLPPVAGGPAGPLQYFPARLAQARVTYARASLPTALTRDFLLAAPLEEDTPLDWEGAWQPGLDPARWDDAPAAGAGLAGLPAAALGKTALARAQKDFLRWLRLNRPLVLFRHPEFKLTSLPEESEGQFRARVAQALRERQDLMKEALRAKYAASLGKLEDQLARARQALSREEEQARASQMDTVVNLGATLLGALFGRKTVSSTTISRGSRTLRSVSRAGREKMDVDLARQKVAGLEDEVARLNQELARDLAEFTAGLDPARLELERTEVTAKASDIGLWAFDLAWLPFRAAPGGGWTPAWE